MIGRSNVPEIVSGLILVVGSSLFLYIKTLSPTVAFWDAGEFITASHVLGIPHPPGTPLYILLGRLFTLIPIGSSVAMRTNLLSAVFSAGAVGFVYLTLVLVSTSWLNFSTGIAVIGSAVGALVLAASNAFWNSAVETEVYGIASCFMTGLLYLAFVWGTSRPRNNRLVYLIIFLLALSIGIHLSSFLIVVGILALTWFVDHRTSSSLHLTPLLLLPIMAAVSAFGVPNAGIVSLVIFLISGCTIAYRIRPRWRMVLSGWILFLLAGSVHLYLPIRSHQNPVMDMGNPETSDSVIAMLAREQYAPQPIIHRKSPSIYQTRMFVDYFREQMPIMALIAGCIGMYALYRTDRRLLAIFGITFLAGSIGLILYLNFKLPPDRYLVDKFPLDTAAGQAVREVRGRDYFFLPAYVIFSYWIGIGTTWILAILRQSSVSARRILIRIAVRIATIGISLGLPAVSVWANYHKADRANDWRAYDFGYNILQSCEPESILFTHGDNDTYSLWYLQHVEGIRTDVSVVCLPLLNTPWYWNQLKSGANNLNLKMNDNEIDAIRPIVLSESSTFSAGDLEVTFKASRSNPRYLRLQDLGILKIIQDNYPEKAIHFTFTTSPESRLGMDEYMTTQGCTFRLLDRPQTPIPGLGVAMDVDKTHHLISDVFQFRGVFDPTMRKTWNSNRLLSNYGRIFSLTAAALFGRSEFGEAVDLFKMAIGISPESLWLHYYLALSLHQSGQTREAVDHLVRLADTEPEAINQMSEVLKKQGFHDLSDQLSAPYRKLKNISN